jgi:hypothetical protein
VKWCWWPRWFPPRSPTLCFIGIGGL